MAVPKRKTSKARRDKRRASSYTLRKSMFVECPQCHENKRPHRICADCGYYNKVEMITID